MLFKNCTIGSDPELFLIDKTTGKIYITRVGAGNDREASYK